MKPEKIMDDNYSCLSRKKHPHPASLSLGFLLPAGRRIEVEGKKGSGIKPKLT
jgi:hypothetical protein